MAAIIVGIPALMAVGAQGSWLYQVGTPWSAGDRGFAEKVAAVAHEDASRSTDRPQSGAVPKRVFPGDAPFRPDAAVQALTARDTAAPWTVDAPVVPSRDGAGQGRAHAVHRAPVVPDDAPLPQRTVDWTPQGLILREIGHPVALPLDGKNYPNRRLMLEVVAGDGTCRLVVDDGEVRVDGKAFRAGESCAIHAGAEVTWEGTAGIRLENPRLVDRVQGSG